MSGHPPIKQADPADSGLFRALPERLALLARNGILFYWASFFILILFEFYIGGRLSVMLSKDHYAIYINVLNSLPFYNVLTNLGISYGIVYFISYNTGLGYRLFRQALRLQFGWYVLLVALHALAFFLFRNVYCITLLITVIISYTYVYKLNITSYFLANRAYGKAAASNMLQKTLLLAVFSFIFYTRRYHLFDVHFTIAYPVLEFAIVLFFFIAFPRTNYRAWTAPGIRYRRRLLRFGKYSMANNALNVLYYTIVAFLIRSSHLDEHLQIIMGLCIVFFRYTAVAIAPVFTTMNPQLTVIKNDPFKVQSLYKKYLIVTALSGVAMLLACRFLFAFFIDHFYDASYHDLPGFFNFFSYLVPLLFLTSLNGSVLAALGKIRYTTGVEVTCTVLLLLFAIYNKLWPVTDYHLFFYLVMAHLCIKFLMLNYGAYKNIRLA